ncbi:glycosyltransferase [Sedimentitalea todarodis]|uniref:Glycosyltransferase n=1 Tax=Sedimentitalea todarodis TaxID=1631240 RepID=A0ABU3VFC4_9RHOB|nr:glycosyltransferase [Sedimentitalea todarodis]MDU9004892.1 glycosyltransferase [Sedimentitalea todarodis]
MNTQNLRLLMSRPAPIEPGRGRLRLGKYLVDNGSITLDQLIRALHMQLTLGAPIGEILVSEGWASPADIRDALAQQYHIREVDLTLEPPDEDLCHRMPHGFWLRHRVIPWKRENGTVLIATDRPDRFEAVRMALGDTYADVRPILASGAQIEASIADRFTMAMAKAAGARVASRYSCRTWQSGNRAVLPAILFLLAVALIFAPVTVLAALSIMAIATLIMFASLKLAALAAFLFHPRHAIASKEKPLTGRPPARRPKISVLVPLFREKEIAGALIRRLERLTYPKTLLDVILVLEEHDEVTRQTLAQTRLPAWMRVIRVPAHEGLTTKPRAMNYALDFCRGDIIGVWDAEDAPAPDQLEAVAARFADAPEDVVCFQGVLDYYNPRTNWLARCFTIEYASWFRVVLPGIARLGLVIPLGGTTLFFRRDKLEELGGWDAHNVTEDADLGVRLCRAGYRTELIDTVTFEEANCRPWPWIKQRSRWLKGFMVTYLVHMQSPRRLLSDLGLTRFLGLQAFFIGTLCQFLLAPVLWSFWLVLLGWFHPVHTLVSTSTATVIAGLFICAELLVFAIGITSVAAPERRFLLRWVPTMPLYFPLAAIAAYKALYELVFRPYYWDKTQHGHAPSELGTD